MLLDISLLHEIKLFNKKRGGISPAPYNNLTQEKIILLSAIVCWAAFVFPVVLWNISALWLANISFASSAIIYIIVLRNLAAFSFTIVLWNVLAALYLVVLRNVSAASSFTWDLLFYATSCCVVAWLVTNITAVAVVSTFVAGSIAWLCAAI